MEENKHLDNLTEFEKRFVILYAQTLNGTQTYLTLKPDVQENSANTLAYELLRKPHVKEALAVELKNHLNLKEDTLARILTLVTFDPTQYVTRSGYIDLEMLKSDGYGWLIKSFKNTKYGTDVIFMDKDKALETLSKIHKLFDDNLTVNIQQQLTAKDRIDNDLQLLRERLNDRT